MLESGKGGAQSEECGHQGVALFPPFSLADAVHLATGINMEKAGGPTIEQADERQQGVGRSGAAKSTKHGVAVDEIPDAINRQPARVDRANW